MVKSLTSIVLDALNAGVNEYMKEEKSLLLKKKGNSVRKGKVVGKCAMEDPMELLKNST